MFFFLDNGLNHIIEEIFGYVEYECHRVACLVSSDWRKAMDNDYIWKNLFNYNVRFLVNVH